MILHNYLIYSDLKTKAESDLRAMKAKKPKASATWSSLHNLCRILTRELILHKSMVGPTVSAVKPAAATQRTAKIPTQ